MKNVPRISVIVLGLIVSAWADSGDKERDRITESANVVKDIFNAPDKGIPLSVLDGTKCVIVIPDLKKAAFVIGGDYGRGVMTCRTGQNFKGPWSAPRHIARSMSAAPQRKPRSPLRRIHMSLSVAGAYAHCQNSPLGTQTPIRSRRIRSARAMTSASVTMASFARAMAIAIGERSMP